MLQLTDRELKRLKSSFDAMTTGVVCGDLPPDDLVRMMLSVWKVCEGSNGIWYAGLIHRWERAVNALLIYGINPIRQIQECQTARTAQAGDIQKTDSVIVDGLTWDVVGLRHRLRTTDLVLFRGTETKILSIGYRSPVRIVPRKRPTAKPVSSYS